MVDPSYVVTVFLVVCSTRGLLALEETDIAKERSRFSFRSGAKSGEAINRKLPSDEINPLNLPLEYGEAFHNGDPLPLERENIDGEGSQPTDKTPKDSATERKALTYRKAQLGGQRQYWTQQSSLQDSYGQVEPAPKRIKTQNYPGTFSSYGQSEQKYVHPSNFKSYVKSPAVPAPVKYSPWNAQYVPAKNLNGQHGWSYPLNQRNPGYEFGDQELNNEEDEGNGEDFYEDESSKITNRQEAHGKETFDDYESEHDALHLRLDAIPEPEEFEERTVMFTGTIKIPKQKNPNSPDGNLQEPTRVHDVQTDGPGVLPLAFPQKGPSQLGPGQQGPVQPGLGQQGQVQPGLGQQGLVQQGQQVPGLQGFKYGLGQQSNLRPASPSDQPGGTAQPAPSSQPGKSGYGQRFPNQQVSIQSAPGKPGIPQSLTNQGGKINQPSKTSPNAVRSYPQYRNLKSQELGIPTRKALVMKGNMIFV